MMREEDGEICKECGERHLVYVNVKAVPDMQQDKRYVCRKETTGREKGLLESRARR